MGVSDNFSIAEGAHLLWHADHSQQVMPLGFDACKFLNIGLRRNHERIRSVEFSARALKAICHDFALHATAGGNLMVFDRMIAFAKNEWLAHNA